MLFNNRKKKLSNFRLRYKGYSILKEQNNLGLWRELKEQFLYNSPLNKSQKFSKLIFGSTYESADLIIHQFCVDRFLPNWLGGQILENLSNHSSLINTPLPNKWSHLLIHNKFRVNKIICKIKFFIVILLALIGNIKIILKIIYNSLIKKSIIYNNSVHFVNLELNNLPPNLTNKNYDLISWYMESKAFINNINYIYHDVYEKVPFIYNSIQIKYNNLPTYSINNKHNIFKFIIWAVNSILISIIDLIRGNWCHALILGEAAKNKVIELKEKQDLSIAYYFHYSSACYRPMWTYTASNKGIDILNYFYSTFEQPSLNTNPINQKFQFYLYNWPKSLLWDERQLNLLQDNCKFKINEHIVGPIWMVDAIDTVPKNKKFTIVVFDTQIHRKYYHFGTSTLSDYYENNLNVNLKFLKDILLLADFYNINIMHKTKRNIGKRSLKSYVSLLNKLNSKSNYKQIDSSISPLKLIENADMVISAPFTSTALYAKLKNKPSFFYDPSGWIIKNDLASHGVPIINNFADLKIKISVILNKNSK
jgi:polysaccharide biosynthesis PFTS motif protein